MSSNWRQPTVEDWESCASDTTDTTDTPTTPPPKYSSFQILDNVGPGSSNVLQLGNVQGHREIDLEHCQVQSVMPGPTWYGKIFNRIPVKKISGYITPGNIALFIGISFIGFIVLCLAISIAVLFWNIAATVVVHRVRIPSNDD
ncbi:hypothetical protein O988_01217 [Pseudogymnoascus sp. VKM F-3808]|nr:hypothetical protein O988_01217 [Pseudogymnoascus sp. VKM F-3808]